jgi:hypothetical protein
MGRDACLVSPASRTDSLDVQASNRYNFDLQPLCVFCKHHIQRDQTLHAGPDGTGLRPHQYRAPGRRASTTDSTMGMDWPSRASSFAKAFRLQFGGRRSSAPSAPTVAFRRSPSLAPIRRRYSAGIRTARLLPHLEICKVGIVSTDQPRAIEGASPLRQVVLAASLNTFKEIP